MPSSSRLPCCLRTVRRAPAHPHLHTCARVWHTLHSSFLDLWTVGASRNLAPHHNLLLSPIKQTVDDTSTPVTSPENIVPTRLRREVSTVTGQVSLDSNVSATETTTLAGAAGQDLRLTQHTPCTTHHQQESLAWHEINTRLQGFGFKRIRFIQLQVRMLGLLS